MKVIALVSGGKDSVFNMMECVRNGHEIVALANLRPPITDNELDSYMYQSVGSELLDMYAEAMDIPMYRASISGKVLNTNLDYEPSDGDEVEDLFQLLGRIKQEIKLKHGFDAEGVSSGAILSTYQKNRVENICQRLGMTSLAFLWERNQTELLNEMIASGINAILIKVACYGLEPEKHLGKTIKEMKTYLVELEKEFGANVCGEGGEYETFTLDCPLFTKRIVIDHFDVKIHSNDAFAKVGYLVFKKFHLENK
ncbi:diphthine--ammonia ligase [Brachionus plicatilis]|uniref:Diphthine--ammonia ligase n=1 Tax=Brachionus plicatilis TaxID=10195 RepID=A0A3M7R6L3_BRAPC|nr:diphthine--ammonia ligase [Brachionus plicatilis]